MLGPKHIESIQPRLKQFRIVMGGLIGGVALFALMAIVVKGVSFGGPPNMISALFFGISLVLVVNAFVVTRFVDRTMLVQTANRLLEVDKAHREEQAVVMLLDAWLNRSLIGAALLEAAAFLNLMALFIEGYGLHLVAAAFIVSLMVVFFPAEQRIVQWIEDRLDELNRPG